MSDSHLYSHLLKLPLFQYLLWRDGTHCQYPFYELKCSFVPLWGTLYHHNNLLSTIKLIIRSFMTHNGLDKCKDLEKKYTLCGQNAD